MSKWFHGFFRSATRKRWASNLRIASTEFFDRRLTPLWEQTKARYHRRARLLRMHGDEHDRKMAIKLLRRCQA